MEAEGIMARPAYLNLGRAGLRERIEQARELMGIPCGVCPRFGKCPLLPMFADSPLNEATPGRYFERHSPFPYGSCQWKAIYNKRVSVERVFSRLKTYRKLDAIRTRRLPKVWLHVALSLMVMNVAALANSVDSLTSLRKCVA